MKINKIYSRKKYFEVYLRILRLSEETKNIPCGKIGRRTKNFKYLKNLKFPFKKESKNQLKWSSSLIFARRSNAVSQKFCCVFYGRLIIV